MPPSKDWKISNFVLVKQSIGQAFAVISSNWRAHVEYVKNSKQPKQNSHWFHHRCHHNPGIRLELICFTSTVKSICWDATTTPSSHSFAVYNKQHKLECNQTTQRNFQRTRHPSSCVIRQRTTICQTHCSKFCWEIQFSAHHIIAELSSQQWVHRKPG